MEEILGNLRNQGAPGLSRTSVEPIPGPEEVRPGDRREAGRELYRGGQARRNSATASACGPSLNQGRARNPHLGRFLPNRKIANVEDIFEHPDQDRRIHRRGAPGGHIPEEKKRIEKIPVADARRSMTNT